MDRDRTYRKFFKKTELSKIVLKSLLASEFFSFEDKIIFQKSFNKFGFKSSISYYRHGCLLSNQTNSVFRLFKLSRSFSKQEASYGRICGLRKSSF